MRDATKRLGGDPSKINPKVPVDLVIDHSVQVDKFRTPDSLEVNLNLEMERNKERFTFLKWGQTAFNGLTIIPPGAGIVHQVNLEFLARVVFNNQGLLYPDSVVGTDSHTPMVNGVGVFVLSSPLFSSSSVSDLSIHSVLVGVLEVSKQKLSCWISPYQWLSHKSLDTSCLANCPHKPPQPISFWQLPRISEQRRSLTSLWSFMDQE